MPLDLKKLEEIEKLKKEKIVRPKKKSFNTFYAHMLNGKTIRLFKNQNEVNQYIEDNPELIGTGHVYQKIKVPAILRCPDCQHLLKFVTVKGYYTYFKCISGHEHKYDTGGNLVG